MKTYILIDNIQHECKVIRQFKKNYPNSFSIPSIYPVQRYIIPGQNSYIEIIEGPLAGKRYTVAESEVIRI